MRRVFLIGVVLALMGAGSAEAGTMAVGPAEDAAESVRPLELAVPAVVTLEEARARLQASFRGSSEVTYDIGEPTRLGPRLVRFPLTVTVPIKEPLPIHLNCYVGPRRNKCLL